MLHGPIGGFAHDAGVVAPPPSRQDEGQVAALGLVLHASAQTAPQGGPRTFAHDPLPASQQPALGRGGIVDALTVRKETLILGTPVKQGVPIGAVAGQAGALIAQHDAHLPQGDIGQQRLIATATMGALGALAQIGLDECEALRGPAQVVGLRPHGALQLWTLGVGEHLVPGGLPPVDHRFATEMMRVHHGCR
jgi:hypothetical protein